MKPLLLPWNSSATMEVLELSLLSCLFANELCKPLFINVFSYFLVNWPTRHTTFAIISVYLELLKDTSNECHRCVNSRMYTRSQAGY